MLGVLVNTIAVLAGSGLGLLFGRAIPTRVTTAVMTAIALCTLYLGTSAALAAQDAILLIIAMALGTAIGTLLNVDGAINRLGEAVEKRLHRGQPGEQCIGEGFVTASLLFCVGSMTIVGSLNAGLTGDNSMLLAKSVLDFISSIMLSVSLGLGVMLSAAFVLVFQGALVLLAGVLKPLLSDAAIAQMTAVGGLLILGLGLNLLKVTKLKIADMLPAVLLAPVLTALLALF